MPASVRTCAVLVTTAAFTVVASLATAQAAFPGLNGRIAFPEGTAINTVNPDGTGAVQLADNPFPVGSPAWSPDGTKLLYGTVSVSSVDLWVVNADGTGKSPLTAVDAVSESYPAWSPTGTQLAFERSGPSGNRDIYIMNIDGTGTHPVTSTPFDETRPAWSPDGTKIAFSRDCDLWTINPDGTGETHVVDQPGKCFADQSVNWSPNGSRLVFDQSLDVYISNADGSNAVNLTNTPKLGERNPAWSPNGQFIIYNHQNGTSVIRPDGTGASTLGSGAYEDPDWQPRLSLPDGYVRPKGAASLQVPLVPAHDRCIPSNRTHGPPLANPSCAPPSQLSETTTVGTPDVNGYPVQSLGSVKIRVASGDPTTLADEADVTVRVAVTDVRRRFDESSDYAGDMQAELTLRMTDRFSGSTADTAATVQDISVLIDFQCVPTESTAIGSTCATATSLDAVTPSFVREGKRTTWEVGQIGLFDGGEDGSAETEADNTLFARQGIFVP